MVQENSLKKILIICGPTASGKTSLAIECAKLLESEVISADSMNVYKCLDIGTAKPTICEMEGVKHHLIDVVSPFENFTVFDYREIALNAINNLHSKGKIPVICGGTGFYINSILYDLSYGNSNANLEARDKYLDLAKKNGNQYVYDVLVKKDPETAKKLHPNDLKRVIRALEICESGCKKSQINDDLTPKFDYQAYSIDFPTDQLYDRINSRVEIMIESGLIDEVKSLLSQGISINYQSMQGIGYKEIFPYLNGEITLEETIELIKLNTRHYAKRQKTFFRKLQGLQYLQPDNPKTLAKRIIDKL